MSTETATTYRSPARRTLERSPNEGARAVLVADVVNVVIAFVAITAGVAPNLDPLSYGPVLLFTTLGVAGATVVYALLDRFVANADRTFTLLAAGVLVLSWIPDALFVPAMPGGTAVVRSRWPRCT